MDEPRRQQFRAQRVRLELPVDLTFPGSSRTVPARSVNVSETGMLVRSGVSRAPGTPVRFDVPPGYGGQGEVAWTGEDGDGGTLLGLTLPRSRHVLLELLDHHLG